MAENPSAGVQHRVVATVMVDSDKKTGPIILSCIRQLHTFIAQLSVCCSMTMHGFADPH